MAESKVQSQKSKVPRPPARAMGLWAARVIEPASESKKDHSRCADRARFSELLAAVGRGDSPPPADSRRPAPAPSSLRSSGRRSPRAGFAGWSHGASRRPPWPRLWTAAVGEFRIPNFTSPFGPLLPTTWNYRDGASVSLSGDPYSQSGGLLVRPGEALYDGCHAAIVGQGVGVRVAVRTGGGVHRGRGRSLPGRGHDPAGLAAVHRAGSRRGRAARRRAGGHGARHARRPARLDPRDHHRHHRQPGPGGGLGRPRRAPAPPRPGSSSCCRPTWPRWRPAPTPAQPIRWAARARTSPRTCATRSPRTPPP